MSEALPVARWGRQGAPSVLLLHGFLGRGTDWASVADALRDDFDLLAPDLPGHGVALCLPDETFTMDGAADILAAALDAEGITRAAVVGYSMGGRLALHFALHHPARVTALALLSASPGLPSEEERAARRTLDAARADEIRADLAGFLSRWYRQPLFSSLTETEQNRLVEDRLRNDPEELARALVGLGAGAQPGWGEHLHRLRVPALAVAGARDGKYVGIARSLAEAGPFETALVPDAGHALLTEAPAAVADLLRRFLLSPAS
ncbi:MAG TPA: 2-succinyl-6-hydroxy-2,4-cyclohexadiene-1-carboxylate synthase [Rubricoccaceae bacterium]|nr:2-succinyl-6-hydroxy-2,4-cyclohexadiene-1-carboxylate synthase [Rubricoccaceae bacterium]